MEEVLLVRRYKNNRTKFYWVMLLVRISNIQYGSTGTFWYTNTWYSSNISQSFSCLYFCAQDVSIPPGQNVSITPEQNVLILLLNYLYIGKY